MRTRGNHRNGSRAGHRAGAVALAGLTLLAIGSGTPALAADQPAPGQGTTSKVAPKPDQKPQQAPQPKPEPVQDLTPPARPSLGEATTEAGGLVRVDVQAEADSALVVREGAEVVASAAATGGTQELSWQTKSGPHTFLLTATDAAGNVSDPAPVTIVVDATPPAAKGFGLEAGTKRDSRTRWGVVTDPGTAYRLTVGGKTLAEGVTEGRSVGGRLLLADGRHDVELELRDEAGNLRTLTGTVVVDVPALWLAVKDVSEPNATERVFKIVTAPGTRGFLRIPGASDARFELPDGRAEVTMEVEEGSYEAPIVIVADDLDRKGRVELEPFEVDRTAPSVTVEANPGAAERGVLSATIAAGKGDTVAWRLVSDSGVVTMSGEFIADGTAQLLEREVAEGSYELEVTATDANGNATAETMAAAVSARPMINPDVVPALTITLVLWVLVGLAVFLRRRARRLRKLAGRKAGQGRGRRANRAQRAAEQQQAIAEHADQVAAFVEADLAWEQRRADLDRLVTLSRGGTVDTPATALELHPAERVFCALPASLVEVQHRDGAEVPVEVEDGQLVVTGTRVAFVGTETREWTLANIQQLRHLGQDITLMRTADGGTTSGVAYADADLVRLYLELAMAEVNGNGRSVRMMLEQGVRSHELRRPQEPAPLAPVSGRRTVRRTKVRSAEPTVSAPAVDSTPVEPTVEAVAPSPVTTVQAPVAVIGKQAEPVDGQVGRELTTLKS